MKIKALPLILVINFLLSFSIARSQEVKDFPFDPYMILKSWNYDHLVKEMGNGEQIIGTMKNQSYIAGMRFPSELFGIKGKLEFSFTKDSISRIQFRKEHSTRIIDAGLSEKMAKDTTARKEYNRSIQILDSLSRDSVVRRITAILGTPINSGQTAATEKNAKYSAIWINRGYSCLFKDYLTYSEVVFSLSTVPLWAVGEFGIPAGTEILRKVSVSTKKMSWTASLLAFPANARSMTYSDVFILLEFAGGQRYLAGIPKSPICFMQKTLFVEFATGQRFLLCVPKNSITLLPDLSFSDCDGDAIPEAMIKTSTDIRGNHVRYYIFSLQYKEPNLIFSFDDQVPAEISVKNNTQVSVTLQDGSIRDIECTFSLLKTNQTLRMSPGSFKYLNSTKFNNDGSTNFVGGIELRSTPESPALGILEIIYKHSTNGWETDQMKLIPIK